MGDILTDLQRAQARADTEDIGRINTKRLNALIDDFALDINDLARAARAADYIAFLETYKLDVNLYHAQNTVFDAVKEMPQENRKHQIIKTLTQKLNLNLD